MMEESIPLKRGISLLKFCCIFFQTVTPEELSLPQTNSVTGSTHQKSVTLVLLLYRNVKKFRTIISEVAEH